MIAAGAISHDPNLAAAIASVSSNWRKGGENVGMGGTVDSLFDTFVASPGHYANLVDPQYTRVGVCVGRDATREALHDASIHRDRRRRRRAVAPSSSDDRGAGLAASTRAAPPTSAAAPVTAAPLTAGEFFRERFTCFCKGFADSGVITKLAIFTKHMPSDSRQLFSQSDIADLKNSYFLCNAKFGGV